MKRLKIILQHNIIYYVVLLIAFSFYFFATNIDHISCYDEFINEKFIITNVTVYDYGIKLNLKGKEKVIGYLYTDDLIEINNFLTDYKLGDTVSITGEINEIVNNTVPYTFNYKKYLTSNEIYNVITVSEINKIDKNNNVFYTLKNFLLHRSFELKKSYPYINSLIFGVNSYLDSSVVSTYRSNGISHLFAISGLHISVFILLISFLLDKLKINTFLKSLIIIVFLLFYMFLTNFSMSVIRSAIFTILLLVNKIFKFEIKTINILLLTLSIILFINPLDWDNVGLKYSFLVSLFLLKYKDIIKGNKVKQLLIISIISFLASYPITVNNFYEVNFLSILYNLLFVPLISYIVLPITLISYVFPFLDSLLYFFTSIIENLSQFFYRFDILKISMCKLNTLFIVSYYVIICKLFNKRKLIYIFVLILFFIVHYNMPFESNDFVTFFDVGQGDSALINVNSNVTVIDTGGIVMYNDKEYTYSLSKNRLLPYLKASGVKKINQLILTHGDFDHMGEAMYLVKKFKVERVIFNCGEHNYLEKELMRTLNKNNIKYQSCIDELNLGNVSLKFLQTREYDNENDNSNVVYFKIDNKKFLFTGDAGVDKEHDILNKYDISDIDVLKVGHHGSNTSSDKGFIDRINPKYSVISVGKNNRYGHPNKEVLDNLENSKIYRTDVNGSIMFKIKNNKLKVEICSP